ncbi:MAG: 4-alpha-glucanotransferase [Acholeplasmatales bacterium]|jgi:4-alpha-glucanotransferase|nr:4-alpha-glucanotransferase [Acholeplasmatales bacterium]
MENNKGLLLHITSLPNNYGIGSLGEEAYKFIDFLAANSFSYWQILPLNPTSFGDSPYQALCAFAGNEYFIDLDILVKEKLLDMDYLSAFVASCKKVNYGYIYYSRWRILKKAFQAFDRNDNSFIEFCLMENDWLHSYALYKTIKNKHDGKPWNEWDNKYKYFDKDYINSSLTSAERDEVTFYKFCQYKFYSQFEKLKKYANDKNVKIIGDIPIYVAYDSSDVWTNPGLFKINSTTLSLEGVAGVPPDSFSKIGQLWGNPIYDWENKKNEVYKFFNRRLEHLYKSVDIVRIDHFIGFFRYFIIPYGKLPMDGSFHNLDNIPYLKELAITYKDKIIAEDLGMLTKQIIDGIKETTLPGMNVLQFSLSDYSVAEPLIKFNNEKIAYTGTHDNDTLIGWIRKLTTENKRYIQKVLHIKFEDEKTYAKQLIDILYSTDSKIIIIPMQDYLLHGNESRMNYPGTSSGNWSWIMDKIPNKQ